MNSLLKSKRLNEHILFFIELMAIVFWGAQLINSDAYYVNYVILLMITAVCIFRNRRNVFARPSDLSDKHIKRDCIIINTFAVLFAFMVAFANYKLWTFSVLPEDYGFGFKWCYTHFMRIMLVAGGFFAFRNIFVALVCSIKWFVWNKCDNTFDPKKVFAVCFGILLVTRLIVLFYCQYPGILSPDSISQIKQSITNNYSNHQPFYHTMVIKIFVSIGWYLFNDINAAVATYSVFQIIFTSLCFAFAVSTMSWMRVPRWIVKAAIMFFVLMPYHIVYAITMWKDVMFGCFVLLWVISFFRCMYEIGNKILGYIVLTISSIGTCLFRSNGFLVFVILTFALIVLWKTKKKGMLVVFVSAIIISFVMKHPVLDSLEVSQPDTIESLSIPAQQIARVVQEGCDLDDWERDLLGEVIDIELIPENYLPHVSDPIKILVRLKGNQNLLVDKTIDYIKLYLSLGIKHPMVYARAWIDQTRGYWNAGYEYWRWSLWCEENDLGIMRTTNNTTINLMLSEYLWLFTDIQVLRLFLSIGLFVWIDILLLMIALLRKDKVGAFVSLPILAIVVSLLVATPVSYEFRYIYAAFCALPMVIVIVLRPMGTCQTSES